MCIPEITTNINGKEDKKMSRKKGSKNRPKEVKPAEVPAPQI